MSPIHSFEKLTLLTGLPPIMVKTQVAIDLSKVFACAETHCAAAHTVLDS